MDRGVIVIVIICPFSLPLSHCLSTFSTFNWLLYNPYPPHTHTHVSLPVRYEVMQSCWQRDVTLRPGFRELGERLKALLCTLPVLEACQEAHYINQGLEAACQGGAQGDNPNLDDAARGNVYLPTPTSAKGLLNEEEKKKNREEEGEDGYLLQAGQAVKKGE